MAARKVQSRLTPLPAMEEAAECLKTLAQLLFHRLLYRAVVLRFLCPKICGSDTRSFPLSAESFRSS